MASSDTSLLITDRSETGYSIKRNMASTYTFLAKITTLIVAVCLGSGFVCSLISMLESGHFSPVFFGIAVLFMAWFVLEYVGLHCKIRFLIIWSCIIWVNFATHFIRKLIDVSAREQLKGNYDLIWAIPLMLFACFKAGVQILLTMEMMKETTEEPKMPPKPTMEKV